MNRSMAARRTAWLLATTVGCTIIAILPPPEGLTPPGMRALALLAWAVTCWAADLMEDYMVAVAMGAGWIVCHVVPVDVALACFSSSSWWMMVGALCIGVAVSESGLLRRAALLTLRALPQSFAGQTAGLILAGIPLGPAIPTVTGKSAMAAPFVLGISEAMGIKDRSRHSTGLFMAMFGWQSSESAGPSNRSSYPANTSRRRSGRSENLHTRRRSQRERSSPRSLCG